jgi:hypothetical protein
MEKHINQREIVPAFIRLACGVALIAAASPAAAGLPSLQADYYRAGLWAVLMFFCWSLMSRFPRTSHEDKYKMMYPDREHASAAPRRSQQKGKGMITLADSLFKKGGAGTAQ